MIEYFLEDISDRWTGLDKSAELELTTSCNARCIMCPREELARPRGAMSRETLALFTERCSEYGLKHISIGGLGEPLLHPDFAGFLGTLSLVPGINLTLTTNAALFDEEAQSKVLDAPVTQVSVSYNGFRKDSYRAIMGLERSAAVKNLEAFIRNHPYHTNKIQLAIIEHQMNERETDDIVRFWRIRGITRFIVLVTHNRAGYLDNTGLTDNDFYSRHDVKTSEEERRLANRICGTPAHIVKFVDWEGKVHICCNDLHGEAILGDLRHDSLRETEARREIVRRGIQSTLCKKCNMPSTLLRTRFIEFDKVLQYE